MWPDGVPDSSEPGAGHEACLKHQAGGAFKQLCTFYMICSGFWEAQLGKVAEAATDRHSTGRSTVFSSSEARSSEVSQSTDAIDDLVEQSGTDVNIYVVISKLPERSP